MKRCVGQRVPLRCGRAAILATFTLVLACGDAPRPDRAASSTLAADTTPVDLSGIETGLPPAVADSPPPPRGAPPVSSARSLGLDVAPPALVAVVEREQGAMRFCYTEFGQKTAPGLRGAVVLAVTVGASGVELVRVAAAEWEGGAGGGVERCLVERAPIAWRLAPGALAAGRYAVELRFEPSG